MSHLLIVKESDDDWNVWITLPDHHPIKDSYGFIVGGGTSKEAAVAEAVKDLGKCIDRLIADKVKVQDAE